MAFNLYVFNFSTDFGDMNQPKRSGFHLLKKKKRGALIQTLTNIQICPLATWLMAIRQGLLGGIF